MDFVKDLLLNYYFIACVSAWLISIVLKAALHSLTNRKKFHMMYGFQNGGMPSSHTSIVAALTFSIFFKTSSFSDLFFISAVFSLLVVADAIRIRNNVGLQGEKINELLKEFNEEPIKVVYGHSVSQVIGGAILGFLCAFILKIILF